MRKHIKEKIITLYDRCVEKASNRVYIVDCMGRGQAVQSQSQSLRMYGSLPLRIAELLRLQSEGERTSTER